MNPKFSMFIVQHYIMKTHKRVDVGLQVDAFLTSVLVLGRDGDHLYQTATFTLIPGYPRDKRLDELQS
jgi:hypothetical protein